MCAKSRRRSAESRATLGRADPAKALPGLAFDRVSSILTDSLARCTIPKPHSLTENAPVTSRSVLYEERTLCT